MRSTDAREPRRPVRIGIETVEDRLDVAPVIAMLLVRCVESRVVEDFVQLRSSQGCNLGVRFRQLGANIGNRSRTDLSVQIGMLLLEPIVTEEPADVVRICF